MKEMIAERGVKAKHRASAPSSEFTAPRLALAPALFPPFD